MSRTRALTRDEIRNASRALKLVEIPVPEWGGVLYARSMSAGEAMDFAVELEKIKDKKMSLALQLSTFVVDQDGNQIWADVKSALDELVNDGTAGPIRSILSKALTANGYGSQELIAKN